jgi:hypothetical protein
VAGDKLSAREAALIAQARAELEKKSSVQPAAPPPPRASASRAEGPAPLARAERAAPVAATEPGAPAAVEPVAPVLDVAERTAALLAAARAETERQRRRQRQLYVWVPAAFISLAGLWTLLWLWQKL